MIFEDSNWAGVSTDKAARITRELAASIAMLQLQPHEPQAVLKLLAFLISHANTCARKVNGNERFEASIS
jgi:hypothetical protein